MSETSVREDTVNIGLLMEAAQTHQDMAQTALQRLNDHAAGLDEVVRDAVRRAVVAEFGALGEHCTQTIESIRGLSRVATRRSVWTGAILAAIPAIIVAVALPYCLPGRAQVAAQKAQLSILQDNVARLAQTGGRIDLRHCGETARLCVRVDRHAPSFGEHADYFVVQGY
jgi:hypothetical protein